MATYTQDFSSGWGSNTDVEDMTTFATRHYPSSATRRLFYSHPSKRIQLDSSGSSDLFSWDEPGSTVGDFTYKVKVFTATASNEVEFFFCWTPDPTKNDAGDGYSVKWTNTTLSINEVANGARTALNSTALGMTNTGTGYFVEIEFDQTSGVIDVYVYRADLSKPGSPTLSATDDTSESGKVGFRRSGGNGYWLDDFSISGDGVLGGEIVAAGLGEVVVSGNNPLVGNDSNIAPGVGAVVVAGLSPDVNNSTRVNAGAGAVVVSGSNPRLSVRPGTGGIVVQGHNASVVVPYPLLKVKYKDAGNVVRTHVIGGKFPKLDAENLRVDSRIDAPTWEIVTRTTTATISSGQFCLANATGGAFAVTLPSASGISGHLVAVKKTDASANAVTVDGSGAETIDGAATATLSSQYDAIQVASDGSNWWIV